MQVALVKKPEGPQCKLSDENFAAVVVISRVEILAEIFLR